MCLDVFVDFFREYRVSLYGLPPGQEFNLLMTGIGIAMLIWIYRFAKAPAEQSAPAERSAAAEPAQTPARRLWPARVLFGVLLVVPTVIPSDWTQDVPARYGERHPGMTHSKIYPPIPPDEG